MYLTDYHTHTKLSPDGSVPLAEMAEAAVAAGLNELCITDHCDLLELYGEPVDHYDWSPALEQYAAVAPRYAGKLTIRLGLEFGMAHLNPEASRAILDRPELDFVLGSIHNLCPQKGGTDFYYVDYPDPAACYAALDDYFASMAQLAVTDFYDVLSHIIYPLRYMDHPISLDRYHDVLDGIFRAAAERAVEGVGHNGDLLCAGMEIDFFWLLNVYFAALMAATKVPLDGPKALPLESARTRRALDPLSEKCGFELARNAGQCRTAGKHFSSYRLR